jgi:hypothetical protein
VEQRGLQQVIPADPVDEFYSRRMSSVFKNNFRNRVPKCLRITIFLPGL